MIDREPLSEACALLRSLGLLSDPERRAAESVLASSFPFAAESRVAVSVHLHIRIAPGAALPRGELALAGWRLLFERPGFVEFRSGPSNTVSFSSIPVAEEDRAGPGPPRSRPCLDHIGFDFPAGPDARSGFDAIPGRAIAAGWGHAAQGHDGKPVHCCFAVVRSKHWVFPPAWEPGPPIEFSIGELESESPQMGDHLRPSAPSAGLCACDGTVAPATGGSTMRA